ncbi:MAG: hypothetical protein JKY80_02080 [Mariprofundaceae bacterium]|nr:hypothetical protein [Mariprofundaceae bacterium]
MDDLFSKKWKLTNERICKPKKYLSPKRVKYEYASDLAKEIGDIKDTRIFALVSGRFIAGDLIEALCVENNWSVERMTISTLSMSQDNIDSLKNLVDGGYVEQLDIIVSEFFYSHERGKDGLIKYIYDCLDVDDTFQLAVAPVHTKMCMIKTKCGLNIVIHGSANLRSSRNIENIIIEDCKELYNFNMEWHDLLLESYSTIRKPIRGKKLWRVVQQKEAAEKSPAAKQKQAKEALRKNNINDQTF